MKENMERVDIVILSNKRLINKCSFMYSLSLPNEDINLQDANTPCIDNQPVNDNSL